MGYDGTGRNPLPFGVRPVKTTALAVLASCILAAPLRNEASAVKALEGAGAKLVRNNRAVVEVNFVTGDSHVGVLGNLAALPALRTVRLGGGKITDSDLKEIGNLERLTTLYLATTKVTDAQLNEVGRLTRLEYLNLSLTDVTDAGLKELRSLHALKELHICYRREVTSIKDLLDLPNLGVLDLYGTGITDEGLKGIGKMKKLWALSLVSTSITDASIKELSELKSLVGLSLMDTKLTPAGLAALKKAVPRCSISP